MLMKILTFNLITFTAAVVAQQSSYLELNEINKAKAVSPWAALIQQSPTPQSQSEQQSQDQQPSTSETQKSSPSGGQTSKKSGSLPMPSFGGGGGGSSPSIGLPIEKPMQLPIPGMQFMRPPKGFTPSSIPLPPMPSMPKPSGPNLEKKHGMKFDKEAKKMAAQFEIAELSKIAQGQMTPGQQVTDIEQFNFQMQMKQAEFSMTEMEHELPIEHDEPETHKQKAGPSGFLQP